MYIFESKERVDVVVFRLFFFMEIPRKVFSNNLGVVEEKSKGVVTPSNWCPRIGLWSGKLEILDLTKDKIIFSGNNMALQ